MKYPNIKITYSSQIGTNCRIVCTDNSSLIIKDSFISSGCTIVADHNGEIEIDKAFIGFNSVIVGREKIVIKKNTQIAEMVVIRDQNHNFGTKNKTIKEQEFSTSSILIEENVWLAAKVTVTAGSKIGKNTVVGANAVVRGILDENSMYVGVPVKKVKSF